MNEHTCPVCGYSSDPEFYPRDHDICGCCGTEFGYDDRVLTYGQLRLRWMRGGFPWFDPEEPQPLRWNPYQQLLQAGLIQYQLIGNATGTTHPAVNIAGQVPLMLQNAAA